MTMMQKHEAIKKLKLKCIKERCRRTTKFRDEKRGGTKLFHYWQDHPKACENLIKHLNNQ